MSTSNSSFLLEFKEKIKKQIVSGHRVVYVIELCEASFHLDANQFQFFIRGIRALILIYFTEWQAQGFPTIAEKDQLIEGRSWKFLTITHDLRMFKPTLEDIFRPFPISLCHYKPYEFTEIALGQTTHFMILDLRNGAHPNTMGRILETISGSGLLLIFCRSLEEYQSLRDPIVHDFVLQFPRQLEEIEPVFFPYLRKSLDALRPFSLLELVTIGKMDDSFLKISNKIAPPDDVMPRFIDREQHPWLLLEHDFMGFPITKDQHDTLAYLKEHLEACIHSRNRVKKGRAIFLSSKRGRGKSTVLGLCLAGFLLERLPSRPYVITAPQIENVQVFFHAILAFLEFKGVDVRSERLENTSLIRGIQVKKRLVVKFREPVDALKEKGSFILVDEAGSIPIPILKNFLKKFNLVIYSSTEQGYEGTGRSFTFRFQRELEEDGMLLRKLRLEQPVRYGEFDLLEDWLYRTLLLEAEPPDVDLDSSSIDLGKMFLVPLKKKELFFDQPSLLRAIVGILVSSHYRNQPNDLFLMADAPHIHVYGIFYRKDESQSNLLSNDTEFQENSITLDSNQLVAAIMVSIEGGFDPKLIPLDPMLQRELRGNVVALTMFRTVDPDFPRWRGQRIIRIAVHPEYQGQGIGSRSLDLLEKESLSQNFDWIGTSFGGSPRLINFWKKNGYKTVHIRPTPSSTTGECSIIMLKAITKEVIPIIISSSRDLRIHVLHWTRELWWYFEPEEVLAFIEATRPYHEWKAAITDVGLYRLNNYLNRTLTYFGAMSVINQLVWLYFLKYPDLDVHLAPIQRKILVVKNLQGWDWNSVAVRFRSDSSKIQGLYVKALKRLRQWFLSRSHEVRDGDEQ